MASQPIGLRLSEEIAQLVDQLAELRGLSKTQVLILGVLAQAEAFGLIPSTKDTVLAMLADPTTEEKLRQSRRLSQQRSRARKRGEDVPKLKPGRHQP